MATAITPRKFVPRGERLNWILTLFLAVTPVWATYNATGYSYYHWVLKNVGNEFFNLVAAIGVPGIVASAVLGAFYLWKVFYRTRHFVERVAIYGLMLVGAVLYGMIVLGGHVEAIVRMVPLELWYVKLPVGLALLAMMLLIWQTQKRNFAWWGRALFVAFFISIIAIPFATEWLSVAWLATTNVLVSIAQVGATIFAIVALRWAGWNWRMTGYRSVSDPIAAGYNDEQADRYHGAD